MQGILNTRTPFYLNHPLVFDSFLGFFVWSCFFSPLKPSCVLSLQFILLLALLPVAFVLLGPDSASLTPFEEAFYVSSGTCGVTRYTILGKISLCHLPDLHLLVKQNAIFSLPMLF